ncbi:hypothetical protein SCLCIDRAFT_253486 [Scleroderma citrinum Foug A]|uniref:Uncharacterized protein n=1 Tax=Scleroderma citrinum Foug A TaxID=1036808 RepID=A0A0C3EFR8_9AGAM|nr:hypothetical protein SCLCIDRAFT_253486 [Scleroderma citrinum Foug A]
MLSHGTYDLSTRNWWVPRSCMHLHLSNGLRCKEVKNTSCLHSSRRNKINGIRKWNNGQFTTLESTKIIVPEPCVRSTLNRI